MMRFLNWTRAAILYEDEFGLVRLQDLVRTPHTKNLELYIRQTTPDNYRMVMREIKKKGIRNIIVDTSSANMNYFFRFVALIRFDFLAFSTRFWLFFRVILQLQMNNNQFHYMFTSFDVEA